MSETLGDLQEQKTDVYVTCGCCCYIVLVRIERLVARRGRDFLVSDVFKKCRCQRCNALAKASEPAWQRKCYPGFSHFSYEPPT